MGVHEIPEFVLAGILLVFYAVYSYFQWGISYCLFLQGFVSDTLKCWWFMLVYFISCCFAKIIILTSFLVDSLGFFKYIIMLSAKRDSFITSLSILIPSIYFSSLLAIINISNIQYWIILVIMGILALFLILRRLLAYPH